MPNLPTLPSPTAYDIAEKSGELITWLRENIKVGFTDERGPAWWANGITLKDGKFEPLQDGSHFPGPIPIDVVNAQLDVKLVKGIVYVEYVDSDGNKQVATDPLITPVVDATRGRVFSYPTAGYPIHPYLETLRGFIDQVTAENLPVSSVGLLKNGGQAFIQAVLPDNYEVAGYGFTPYVGAATSADMSRATSGFTGIKGAVCDNTLDAAVLAAFTSVKVRHTRNSLVTLATAHESLGIQLVKVADVVGSAIENLTAISVTDQQWQSFLDELVTIPAPNPASSTGGKSFSMATAKQEGMKALWLHDPKVAPWAGTAFGVLQAANTYRTWNGIVRGADGGRLERNFTNDVCGATGKADLEVMSKLAKVLDRELVTA